MKILTFYDFSFRARHTLKGRAETAAHPHWHSYRARLWFTGPVDQDWLVTQLERVFAPLHGAGLNAIVQPDSSDESVAAWLMGEASRKIAPPHIKQANANIRTLEILAEARDIQPGTARQIREVAYLCRCRASDL